MQVVLYLNSVSKASYNIKIKMLFLALIVIITFLLSLCLINRWIHRNSTELAKQIPSDKWNTFFAFGRIMRRKGKYWLVYSWIKLKHYMWLVHMGTYSIGIVLVPTPYKISLNMLTKFTWTVRRSDSVKSTQKVIRAERYT